MRKCTSWIWVFFAFKVCRIRSTIRDKIRKSLLSHCYHVYSYKLLPLLKVTIYIYTFVFLERDQLYLHFCYYANLNKCCMGIWQHFEVRQKIGNSASVACPAFLGQEFKGKKALCCTIKHNKYIIQMVCTVQCTKSIVQCCQ